MLCYAMMYVWVWQVLLYRSGLVIAAASFVVAASAAFLPRDNWWSLNGSAATLDFLYVLGSGGLGLSLLLIHIYVSEIKRTLQALWGLGVLGSLTTYITLAQPANTSLIQYVVHHNPSAVWLVGPLFAALTGLVFKEGNAAGCATSTYLSFPIKYQKNHSSKLSSIQYRTVLWQARSWTSHVSYSYTSSWPYGIPSFFLL